MYSSEHLDDFGWMDININQYIILYILYTRKCYSIVESEGEFYIGGFVLLKFIEPSRHAQ